MLIAKWTRVVALSAALAAPALQAEPFLLESPSPNEDAGFSLNIAPGRRIVVEQHKGLGKKVKGQFVGSDIDGITVDTKKGIRRTVPWASVSKVKAKRSRLGFWMGMAAGAALAGATLLADDSLDAAWTAAWIANGAGSVGLWGAAFETPAAPLYEAPEPENSGP